MTFSHPRLQREKRTIEAMTALYCHDQHASRGGQLCPECQEMQEYALARLARCPFQENKSTCANCRVHCYTPTMRQRVKGMMRYAGPRMLLRHPILAILHLLDGRKEAPQLPAREKKSRAGGSAG
jgi:hypothetical protein